MAWHKLSDQDWADFAQLISQYKDNKYILLMKEFIQHGKVTTYDHVFHVAKRAFVLNRFYQLKADEESLIGGAILHDFFLYDWHHEKGKDNVMSQKLEEMVKSDPLLQQIKCEITHKPLGIGPGNATHRFKHALIACENAKVLFGINPKEEEIIKTHMWPIAFKRRPRCREAWIVCLADKEVSLQESLFRKKLRFTH